MSLVIVSLCSVRATHADNVTPIAPTVMQQQQDPMFNEIQVKKRPKYTAEGEYGGDSKHRRNESLNQYLEFLHWGNMTWQAVYRLSQYMENAIPTVKENAGGLGINQQFGLFHNLDIKGMINNFSNDLKTTYSVSGRFDSIWTDNFQTHLGGERAPVYTARALDHETTDAWGEASMELKFLELWRTTIQGRRTNFSDDNRRTSGNFALARSLKSRSGFRIEYRFTADNMDIDSPDYYSPHHLTQHQIGFDWPIRWEKDVRFEVAYLPGIGKETNASTRVVHSFTLDLRKTWRDRLTLGLSAAADTTPTYKSAESNLSIEYRF